MEKKSKGNGATFMPLLPLKNVVALPKSIIPVIVGRELSIKAVEWALRGNREIFVTAQKAVDVENPLPSDLYEYGTRAIVLQVSRLPNDTLKILIEGMGRGKIVEYKREEGTEFIGVMVEPLPIEPIKSEAERTAMQRSLFAQFKEYVGLNERLSNDVLDIFKEVEDLDHLVDSIAVQMNLDFQARQELLEILSVRDRVVRLSAILHDELEILRADKNIKKRVQSQVEKHQRDYYLNEQMRAIQRELGRDDFQQDIDALRERAKKAKLPKDALEKVETECRRLEQMQPTAPEASVSRNYIEWVITVPWKKETKDNVTIDEAQKILDGTHAGMKKAKERIIEFLAAKKFAGDKLERPTIICLAGPPGVGKTSLARSIADSLGRKMVRLSLGGLRDEAEIRGHRRTYIGAMPGKIIQAMKKSGVINPVIVLDEIDKMSMDFRGDPASALLEVLDPEQNKEFVDHFLEVDYDLSGVMFITTANVIDNIPLPLLDRMEIVSLSGYTDTEKFNISRTFLLPKLLKEHNLKPTQMVMSDDVLKKVIDGYTKEAGVRQLDRVLAKLVRKTIQELLEDSKKKTVSVTEERIEEWLGAVKFKRLQKQHGGEVGLVTGLAWTEVGGDVMDIEVTLLKGKGALTLTGQLGEVMQESAQAALSYIRSRAKEIGLKDNFYSDLDIHIHLPEGAIPKDGPSAGIGLATVLTSALTNIPLLSNVALTGEVTLRGRVLPVGGLKEKLLAAARSGITKAIVPKENQSDIKEFLNELDSSLKIFYAESMDEVLNEALAKSPFVAAPKKAVTTKSATTKVAKKVTPKSKSKVKK